ncbi:hypothetical protein DFH07DRAFT_785756 [Mycena maculata]|uniref:Uncharacterized protein n=1 Tax=Mycena maculata TaxID=230809 RepID=A0AAD7H922_9AGAR|nr:hypothetical protein DFH07DRAFT_785756 [Mycena maculata]
MLLTRAVAKGLTALRRPAVPGTRARQQAVQEVLVPKEEDVSASVLFKEHSEAFEGRHQDRDRTAEIGEMRGEHWARGAGYPRQITIGRSLSLSPKHADNLKQLVYPVPGASKEFPFGANIRREFGFHSVLPDWTWLKRGKSWEIQEQNAKQAQLMGTAPVMPGTRFRTIKIFAGKYRTTDMENSLATSGWSTHAAYLEPSPYKVRISVTRHRHAGPEGCLLTLPGTEKTEDNEIEANLRKNRAPIEQMTSTKESASRSLAGADHALTIGLSVNPRFGGETDATFGSRGEFEQLILREIRPGSTWSTTATNLPRNFFLVCGILGR